MDASTQLQQIDPLYVQLFFIGLSLFTILIEMPLALNRIAPNQTYGFRVAKTLSDDRIWYAANSYAAKWSIVTCAAAILLALLLRLTAITNLVYGCTLTAVLVGGLMLTIITTLIYIRRIS